ncbi:MAG: ZIP family metal transporter [Spirochaetaceae bacterium]
MQSLLYSFIAGVSTTLGALIVFVLGRPTEKLISLLLGFAAGIMLSISTFDLLPEALELGTLQHTLIGFIGGAALMYILDKLIPHKHISGEDEQVVHTRLRTHEAKAHKIAAMHPHKILRTGYLIFLGVALHNFPEGMAIGAGLESSPELGLYVAIAIGLHNIPEGVATAGPLRAGGLSWLKVISLTLAAGLMTPVGAGIGLIVFSISPVFISIGLSFAAGAMIYIVSDELIPTSHHFHSHNANIGFMIGFIVGLVLL